MKKLFEFILLLVLVVSCNINQYQKLPDGTIRKPEIVSEYFSVPADSMIIKCQDLHGFGPLSIGKTTFSEASKLRDIFPYESNKNSFYSTYGLWGTGEYDIAKRLEKNQSIKRLESAISFKIGELKFNKITLAFYNDILVAIAFDPEYEDQILNYYIGKFGNGDGHRIIKDYFYKDYTKDKYYHNVEHTWYNNNVKFTYKEHVQSGPNIRSRFEEDFLMTDNTGNFEKFLDVLQSVINSAHEQETESIQKSFDLL